MTEGNEHPSWDGGVKLLDFRAALFSVFVIIIGFLLVLSINFSKTLI